MGWKFNPFTGQLDQTGSGGGGAQYIDGEVQYYADLSLDAGVAALNSAWLVREASGAWPLTSRKPAGIYIRTATGGTDRDADYTYAGVFPDVFSDANFTVYNEADATKNVKLDASGVTTGTTRTLTAPDASGVISLNGHTHDVITSTSGVNKFKLGLGGDSATGRFTGVTTAADPLVGVFSYANEASYNASSEVASSRWGMTLGANGSAAFVQYLKNGSVQATYTLPSSGGTVALTDDAKPVELVIACSDETTDLSTGTAKVTLRMPYAMTLTAVRASVTTAPVGSTLIVDINEGGVSVLGTKLSIDASEKTSTTATSAATITDSALADDAEITIDIDQIGSTTAGAGLKVALIGTRA